MGQDRKEANNGKDGAYPAIPLDSNTSPQGPAYTPRTPEIDPQVSGLEAVMTDPLNADPQGKTATIFNHANNLVMSILNGSGYPTREQAEKMVEILIYGAAVAEGFYKPIEDLTAENQAEYLLKAAIATNTPILQNKAALIRRITDTNFNEKGVYDLKDTEPLKILMTYVTNQTVEAEAKNAEQAAKKGDLGL